MRRKALITFLLAAALAACPIMTCMAEVRLDEADKALAAQEYLKAKDLYRTIFISERQGPVAEAALLGVVRTDYQMKYYHEAATGLKRFFSVFPNSVFANEAGLLGGKINLKLQKYGEAKKHFEKVREPLVEEARIALAEIAFNQGDSLKSEQLLRKLDPKPFDSNNRVIYLRAMIESHKGNHAEAIKLINRIRPQDLAAEDITVSKAIVYYNAQRFEEAKEMLRVIISAPTSQIELFGAKRTMFLIRYAEGQTDEAIALGLELLSFDFSDDLKLKLIELYDSKKDLEGSFRYLSNLKDKKKQFAELDRRFRQLIDEKHPKTEEYLRRYGWLVNPENPLMMEIARYLLERGKRDEARRLFQKVAATSSGMKASLILAEMAIADGRNSEAKKLLGPVSLDPLMGGDAADLLIRIYEKEKNTRRVAELVPKAIKSFELRKEFGRVGELYLKLGKKQEALNNFIKAADKGDAISAVKAADLFYVSGRNDRAKVYYKKALDGDLGDNKLLQWASYQYGKMARDNDYLKKAAEGGGQIGEAASLLMPES